MSRSPPTSPVYFYSPRMNRKQYEQASRQQQHEDQSNFLFDSRHLNLPSHSLSTFSTGRKLVRRGPVDTLNRYKCSQEETNRNSDKIIIRTTNHTDGAADASTCFRIRTSSSSSSSSSPEGSKRHSQRDDPANLPALRSKPTTAIPDPFRRPSSASAESAVASLSSPVSRVSSEMEQEIESLNSLIDYINTELQTLVNEDEIDEQEHPPECQDGDRRLSGQKNNAAGDETEARKSDDAVLIDHPEDQQFEQPDPVSGCLLTFCQKSLHDSADTVIDGCSSKDMSSSADFSDENDGLSKGDMTASEDEQTDEGIQCNSADQLLPFNHLTVLEIEAFLRKHRKGDPLKDEGKDSILFFPDFVREVMEFLVKRGLKKEGIFRRCGVKSRINLLMNSSHSTGSMGNNNNNSLNQSRETMLEEACAYDVADFLKGCNRLTIAHVPNPSDFNAVLVFLFLLTDAGWFRNQDPLLTAAVVSTLLPLISKIESGESDMNALRAGLLVLPNRLALEALLRFLSKFAARSDKNVMNVSNLAIVWAPSICREGSHGHGFPGPGNHLLHSSVTSAFILESVSLFMRDARAVLEFLLHNTDQVFSIPRNELVALPKIRISNSPSIPSILCRSSKIMSASPYEVFLKIVINRSSWDPLVVETSDDGDSQRIKHSFSRFVPNGGSIRITRQLNRPSPTDETIQIHEESVDDGRSYTCDWLITSTGSSGVSHSKSSEVALSLYYDLKGRPLIWYKKSFPRLLETYLNSINSSFPGSKSDRNSDRSSAPFSCCFFMRQAVNA